MLADEFQPFDVTFISPSPAGSPAPSDVPTFAGLLSATTTCTASAPEVLPRPSTYTLTWQPATDPVTPSSAIVYEIFLATSSGAEDYAQPTWTTSPGATSFTTPGLAPQRPPVLRGPRPQCRRRRG